MYMYLRIIREVKRCNGIQEKKNKTTNPVRVDGRKTWQTKHPFQRWALKHEQASQGSDDRAAKTLAEAPVGAIKGSLVQLLNKYLLSRHYVQAVV